MELTHTYPPFTDIKPSILSLIRKLVNDCTNAKEFRVSPSMFMEEMKLSTEERLEKLKNSNYKPKMMPTTKNQIFLPEPEVVLFQNYKAGVVYRTTFQMRNKSRTSKPLRIVLPPSPFFTVTYASECISTHVAPGIPIAFNVKFFTDELKDYRYDMSFVTEDETIPFPIYALKPRPLLDLPDEICLPPTAVRVSTEKCVFARNVGEAQANFLTSTNEPFAVSIDKGILEPKDLMKLTVSFNPVKLGTAKEYLTVSFDTGETLSIKLRGQTENANINFEKGSLHFHRTFVGLTRLRNVVLFNNSKYNVKFQWKLYSTKEEENSNLDKIKNSLKMMKSNEILKSNKLVSLHIIDKEGESNVYQRIYDDELQELDMQDQYPYQNPYFQIVPMSGDIFANSRFEFSIFFTPAYVGNYSTRGFLDVTGRNTRAALILNGSGIGPYIELNMESLDANKLYMCALHQYEVVAINKGDIPGTIVFPAQELEFGGNLCCEPLSQILQPNECGRFDLKFSSMQQGNFFEEIIFMIEESSEKLRLVFMGEIICPYLTIDAAEFNYGTVPIGITKRKKFELSNSSMVPIDYSFFVYGDGDIPAVTCKEYACLPMKCPLPKRPREFDYNHRHGVVQPLSSIIIELSLTANLIRQVQTSLMLKMWNSDRHTASIPLTYTASTPRVVCIPPEVNIRFCFITYPYYRNITLRNESDLPGLLELNLSETSQMKGIQCSISKSNVFIQPHEDVEIHMVIKTSYLGEDRLPILMSILGGKPFQCCSVICFGQGPVVGVSPEDLDFGKIRLLREAKEEIRITNDSPIVAPVTISIKPNSWLKVEPKEVVLELEQSAYLTVTICIFDPVRVQDTITVSAEQGNQVICKVRAKGFGTSIQCEPELEPEICLGILLTYQEFRLPVTLTNRGRRHHKLLWHRSTPIKVIKPDIPSVPSIFTFRPNLMEISGNEEIISVIRGYNRKVGFVKEEYYCHASIENSNNVEIIMSINILATFVDPRLEISKNELRFIQDYAPNYFYEFVRDDVVITNISQVPLNIRVVTEGPFYIDSEGDEVVSISIALNHCESYRFYVCYKSETEEFRCKVITCQLMFEYEGHPKKDFINLIAEISCPTVEITPKLVIFPFVPPEAMCFADLVIKNISSLTATYHFEWQEKSFVVDEIEETMTLIPEKKRVNVIEIIDDDECEFGCEDLEEDDNLWDCRTRPSEVVLQVVDFELTENKGSLTSLPIVYFFQKVYTEVYQHYHNIELIDFLTPPISLEDSIVLPEENVKRFKDIRSFLFPIFCGCQEPEFDEILRILPKDATPINPILDVTPLRGVLKPFECQSLAILFKPKRNTYVIAELACHVECGPTEYINIEGKSCSLSYMIETVQVDFGRQIFCVVIEKTVTLTNTCCAPFTFTTSAGDVPIQYLSTHLLGTAGLRVCPKQAELQPGESIQIQIQYLPVISGEFNEKFTLKVGYLPKIDIEVHGYADFPQAYLGERPSLKNVHYSICYWAIATLTTHYLKTLKNINYILRCTRNMPQQYDIPQNQCRFLKEEGWVVISYHTVYPSAIDIDMAIERMLLYHHIFDNPSVLTKHLKVHKETLVPEFSVPEYVVNLGYVIIDDKTRQKINMFNYGPTRMRFKILSKIDKRSVPGLEVESVCSGVLQVGQIREITIGFCPTRDAYKKEPLNKEIEFFIYIHVGHGPKIPIHIFAVVTIPELEPSTVLLNFGEVRCGHLKKRSLIFENNGFVECSWKATIQKTEVKRFSKVNLDCGSKRIFYLLENEDTILPGGKTILDVYFEPQYDGYVDWILTIVIEKNPKHIEISVRGLGRLPTIKMCPEVVEFDPVLPYTPDYEKTFKVQNTCALPIEFFFFDFDMQYEIEVKILNLLCEYYNTNRLIIPPREPGDKLPHQFFSFYETITEDLHKKLIQISLNALEEVHDNSLRDSMVTLCSGRKRSSNKKKSVSARSGNSVEERLEAIASLLPKDPNKLQLLLTDYVCNLQPEDKAKLDPIADALADYKDINEKIEPPPINEGVYLLFHGSPRTNHVRAAYKASFELNIPVYSIDSLIKESLIKPQDSNVHKVRDIIHKEYLKQMPNDLKSITPLNDPLQEIEIEIELLIEKHAHTEKQESKKDKKRTEKNIFLDISEDLITELLKNKLASFRNGVIIEGLHSKFILNSHLALQMCLKAMGNVKYLHCIILSYTYQQHLLFEEAKKWEREEEAFRKHEEKLERMMNMEYDDLLLLSPEDYQIYVTEILDKRRLVTLMRRESLRKRLMELRSRKGRSKKHIKTVEPIKRHKSVETRKDVSKVSTKGSTKVSPKEKARDPMKQEFDKFEEELKLILHLLEYWDRKQLICLKAPVAAKSMTPTTKTNKKSKLTKSVTPRSLNTSMILIKDPMDFKELTCDEEMKIIQTGVPCWIIDDAHEDKPVDELVATYLMTTPDFQNAVLSLEENLKEHFEEMIELRSVVYLNTDPSCFCKNISDAFVLKDTLEEQSLTSVKEAKGKDVCPVGICKRRRSQSKSLQSSELSASKRVSIAEDLAELDLLTVRTVLGVGERKRYRVIFKPEFIGHYEHTFTLQVAGWPTKYYLTCQGKADIPCLNMTPEVVFPKVMKKRTKKTQNYNNIFLSDLNVFDFGPVLSIPKIDSAILACEAEFNFKNTSLIPCVTTFSILNQPSAFVLEREDTTISPGVTEVLNIRAMPNSAFEIAVDQLIISIKDNPAIYIINLSSQSCNLTLELTPKLVRFDRVLVETVKEETLVISNNSLVPVCWELGNLDKLLEYFRVIPISGCLDPDENEKITLQFYSEIPKMVPKQPFTLDIYDNDYKSVTPIHSESVDVIAEAMLVPLMCETDIDLGEIKGQTGSDYTYEIMSQGKHNVEFAITPVTKTDDPKFKENKTLRSYFEIVPTSGILIPQKIFNCELKYFCKKPLIAKRVPLFAVTFVDSLKKTLIKTFVLTVTFRTKFALYELSPPEEVNFGYQLIASESIQTLKIANQGDFEFEFNITLPHKEGTPVKEGKGKKTSGKGSKDDKRKKTSETESKESKSKKTNTKEDKGKKTSGKESAKSKRSKSEGSGSQKKGAKPQKPTKLDFGCFSLTPSTGVVEANQTIVIEVLSRPTHLGEFKESVLFHISQSQESEIQGKPFQFITSSVCPEITFSNIGGIFREVFVVDTMGAVDEQMLIDANGIFIKDTMTLYFPRKVINKETQAHLRLENIGPVSAELLGSVSSEDDVFMLQPKLISVEAYSVTQVTISFIPNSINVFKGSATIAYSGLDMLKLDNFQINIMGEGIVPQISLIKPKYDTNIDAYSLHFSPTFLNCTSTRSVIFVNVGLSSCKVVIELCEGNLDVFSLIPHPDCVKFLAVKEDVTSVTAHTNSIHLDVGQKAEFFLEFTPNSINTSNCVVKLHTVNNPYEMITIYTTAEAFDEVVSLEGLPTYPIKTNNPTGCTTGYILNFGDVNVGNYETRCFKIINHSPTDIYKFEFGTTNKVMFLPGRGHLNPRSCKEVVVTFLSKEPSTAKNMQIECTCYQITYLNPQLQDLSWDERQTVVAWEPGDFGNISRVGTTASLFADNAQDAASVKSLRDKDEPSIEAVPDTLRLISLLVSAVSDYASYKCSKFDITMEDTLAFESRSEIIEVTNTSNVSYNLEWVLTLDATYSAQPEIKETDTIAVIEEEDPELLKLIRKTLRRPIQLTGKEKFLGDHSSETSSQTSMFSAEGNLLNMGDEPCANDVMPFEVKPSKIVLEPKQTESFTVIFKPRDIFNYLANMKAKIPKLNPSQKTLIVTLNGKSLLPLYHIDVPESNYVSTRRDVAFVCNDLITDDTTVIEFEAIGLDEHVTRSFNILNTGTENFSFKWHQENSCLHEVSSFHCHRSEGLVKKCKMAEATFTFVPCSIGTFEVIYMFTIEKYEVRKPFLLVGFVRESLVHFSKPFIQIRPSVLALDISDTTLLINKEDFEVDFKFRKESLYSDAHHQALTIDPMCGTVDPHGKVPIKVTYHATKVGEIQFNLECFVTKMRNPLTLSVNAVCHKIKPQVYFEADDSTRVILNPAKVNAMELNSLAPFTQRDVLFTICNTGQTGFYYSWNINQNLLGTKAELRFYDSEGFVPTGEEIITKMSITLLTKVVIRKLVVKLQIRYGPTYMIHLSGTVVTSVYNFSFSEYDFGPCLIQKEVTSFYKVVLEITNSDDAPVTLECKQPEVDFLTIQFNSKRINPKTVEAIEILFHPFKIQHCCVEVMFYLNSKLRVIRIRGEGVPLVVRLVNSNDKFLNFGSVPVSKTSSISVAVQNDGLSPIEIFFEMPDRLPININPKPIVEPSKNKSVERVTKSSSQRSTKSGKTGKHKKIEKLVEIEVSPEEIEKQLLDKTIMVTPKKFIKVAAQQSTQFVITFLPTERMKPFTGKIAYQVQDMTETICVFKGCSVGANYVLDKKFLPFGSVILGYFSKQKVVLNNVGDIGGTFKWTFERSQSNFTIAPDNGYICAHSTVLFTVHFKPSGVRNLFQEKVKCQITNYMKTMELTLSGSCINMPPAIAKINFDCPVRELERKTIPIENNSSETKKVSTTVSGQYFFSKDFFTIAPKSLLNCEVCYRPFTTTSDNPHKGNIFFAFPEGQGLLYDLEGCTKPPLVVKKINRDVKSKTAHNEILEVKNWLKVSQTFDVVTESLGQGKVLYNVTSNSAIEVLGGSTRDYTWSIFIMNEGLLQLQVTFRNKDTNEFMFYLITFNVLKSPTLDVITLTSCLRKPVTHLLPLVNPLKYPVIFTAKSSVPELSYPSTQTVEAFSQANFVITYKPTTVGEINAHIDIVSSDLGTYPYDLKLFAIPAVPEQALVVSAKLGRRNFNKIKLTNTYKNSITFHADFADPDLFYFDGALSVGGNTTKEFNVYFEPAEIGTISSILNVAHPQTGEYTYILKGTGEMPQPQGPFFVIPGRNITITFKNPFVEVTEFRFVAEPAIFSVNSEVQSLKGRTDVKILVSLVPIQNLEVLIDRKYAITGRLTVQPTKPPLSHIKWVYYLHGDLNA